MPRKAAVIHLTPNTHEILNNIARSRTLGIDLTERATIILGASQGLSNVQIAEQENFETHRIAHWRNHWVNAFTQWQQLDEKLRPPMSQRLVIGWLTDQKGRGRKATITPEQKALILAVACEAPSESGYPHSHWTCRLLAQEVIKRGIVTYIAFQTVCSFLNAADLKPHKSRYWLNPTIEDQEVFEQEVKTVCQTFLDAEANAQNGIHTVATDEKTGIQALERTEPDQPMAPGQPVRREYNYKRHGTRTLFVVEPD